MKKATECNTFNGTYKCQRPAGHTGEHKGILPATNTRPARIYAFANRYSPIRFGRS